MTNGIAVAVRITAALGTVQGEFYLMKLVIYFMLKNNVSKILFNLASVWPQCTMLRRPQHSVLLFSKLK